MFAKRDRIDRPLAQNPRQNQHQVRTTNAHSLALVLAILVASGVSTAQVAPPMDTSATRTVPRTAAAGTATAGATLGDRYRTPTTMAPAPVPVLSPAIAAATLEMPNEWRPTARASQPSPDAPVARTAPQWLGQVKSWVRGVDDSETLPPPPANTDAQALLGELLHIPAFAAYYAEHPAPIPSQAGEARAYLHLVTLASRFIGTGASALAGR